MILRREPKYLPYTGRSAANGPPVGVLAALAAVGFYPTRPRLRGATPPLWGGINFRPEPRPSLGLYSLSMP